MESKKTQEYNPNDNALMLLSGVSTLQNIREIQYQQFKLRDRFIYVYNDSDNKSQKFYIKAIKEKDTAHGELPDSQFCCIANYYNIITNVIFYKGYIIEKYVMELTNKYMENLPDRTKHIIGLSYNLYLLGNTFQSYIDFQKAMEKSGLCPCKNKKLIMGINFTLRALKDISFNILKIEKQMFYERTNLINEKFKTLKA